MANILTWEEMVEKYPDMWVAIKNPIYEEGTLMGGEFIEAVTDDEVDEHEIANFKNKYLYVRTSLTFKVGVINAN